MQKKALIVANLVGFVGFLWNDIKLLQSKGYEVHFAANAKIISGENTINYLENKGIVFHQLDFSSNNPFAKNNIKAFRQIRRILKSEKYSFVHCHTPIAGFITRLATASRRRKGVKVVYTTHGFSFTFFSSKKQRFVFRTIEKIASAFTDIIITINREDCESAKKLFCKDVRMINGVGVDTKKYHDVEVNADEYKKKLSLPLDKTMVLSVGELSNRKNHQIIIKALGQMEEKEKYMYVICGREVSGTGIADNLRKLAQEYGVELYLLGHRSDIPEIMHCSDIGAIPSVREGLGLAGIQSLCAEVPLVGTRVQGIKDYIIDDKTGYLCDPFDASAYMEAIKKLSDKTVRNRMKEECYKMAQKYDQKVSFKQMSQIYNDIIQ